MPLDATRAEIAGTPAALANALESLAAPICDLAAALARRHVARVAVVGSGDSLAVGMMAAPGFAEFAGKPVETIQAYEYATYGHPAFGRDLAAFLISSSGRPSPTRDALTRALGSDAFVVGVSDRAAADNPFLTRPTHALCPGSAKRGMPTQSTIVTLAVLLRLAVEWGRTLGHVPGDSTLEELRAVSDRLAATARTHGDTARAIGASLAGWRRIHIVGAGPNVGTAHAGALLFAGAAGLVATAHAVEEIHHALRLASLGRQDMVLVLLPPGTRAEARLIDTIAAAKGRGAHVVVLGTGEVPLPGTLEPFSPLLLLPILQQIALGAGQAVAQGATAPFRTRPVPPTELAP